MQRGTVVDLNNFKYVIKFFKDNKSHLLLSGFFVLGIILGIYFNLSFSVFENWNKEYLQEYISGRNSSNFFEITITSFLNSMLFIFLAFSFGGSIFGIVLVPVCVALKGISYGGITSFLYSQYGLQGIAFNAVLIIPPAFIFLFGFLFASLEALDFSLTVLKLTFPKSVSTNLYLRFKRYCRKYVVICFIILISGIFDALICSNSLTKFNI